MPSRYRLVTWWVKYRIYMLLPNPNYAESKPGALSFVSRALVVYLVKRFRGTHMIAASISGKLRRPDFLVSFANVVSVERNRSTGGVVEASPVFFLYSLYLVETNMSHVSSWSVSQHLPIIPCVPCRIGSKFNTRKLMRLFKLSICTLWFKRKQVVIQ